MDQRGAAPTSYVDDPGRERRSGDAQPLVVLPRVSLGQRIRGGGTEGNERLTVITGLLLIVLFAALGVTIVFIGQLLWLHLFLGLVLVGPVMLKLASTGYRFMRYYTHDAPYRLKGPPPPVLRGLAPVVVSLTVAVFATGVALLFVPRSSDSLLQLAHKAAFIGWVAATALHVLGHLPETIRLLIGRRRERRELGLLLAALGPRAQEPTPAASYPAAIAHGELGRRTVLLLAPLAGLILALALTGQFSAWTG